MPQLQNIGKSLHICTSGYHLFRASLGGGEEEWVGGGGGEGTREEFCTVQNTQACRTYALTIYEAQ